MPWLPACPAIVLEPAPLLEPGLELELPADGLDAPGLVVEPGLLVLPVLELPPCTVPVTSTRLFTYCFRLSVAPER
jgi:hypothetical protein